MSLAVWRSIHKCWDIVHSFRGFLCGREPQLLSRVSDTLPRIRTIALSHM